MKTPLCAALLVAAGFAPAAFAAGTLTPLVVPASQEHHVGKVIFSSS